MKIIYVMDALCGWCYGNIESIANLYRDFKDHVEFEVLPGGMWAGTNARVQSVQMMNYFLKHDAIISERTGVEFGDAYIDFIKTRHDVMLDSEIPSRAIVTIGKSSPDLIVPFAVEIQRARYFYGKDLNLEQTYSEILAKLQIDENSFFDLFKTEELKVATQDAFRKAAGYVRSYPTLLAEQNGQAYVLEQGYMPYEEVKKIVQENFF